MKRRHAMCDGCPFRIADKAEREAYQRDGARVEMWTCHEEDGYSAIGDSDIQCRGHFEARRKYAGSAPQGAVAGVLTP